MKTFEKKLLKIFLASVLIFILSVIFSKNQKNAQRPVETALLNPGFSSDVSSVLITKKSVSGVSEVRIEKQGDFWLLSENDGICSFADSKIVNSLIENAAKLRKIYKISGEYKDFVRLGVDDDGGSLITFSEKNGKTFSKIYFGLENQLKNRIYFRVDTGKTAYETENDFSQYLTVDLNYWAEPEIFPEIKNPVAISFSGENNYSLDEKSRGFASVSHTLLSLRHGKICGNFEDFPELKNPASSLTVQDGEGRISKIEFFEKIEKNSTADGEIEKSYFYKKSILAAEIDAQENIFAFYSQNAVYEISLWTFERIKNAAQDF
ncbi:MAG: DUF4340 domain-containing protein [Treponema sp.]|nr:DUF4340 domain-containing protein [Treponema sp.]